MVAHWPAKTTLAKAMAGRVRCSVIDGDDFIVRKQDMFIGALKVDALRERIETNLAATSLVVLSTVCAREVVKKVGVPAAASSDRTDFDDDHRYRRARLRRRLPRR
jgi:hypothetical protein